MIHAVIRDLLFLQLKEVEIMFHGDTAFGFEKMFELNQISSSSCSHRDGATNWARVRWLIEIIYFS